MSLRKVLQRYLTAVGTSLGTIPQPPYFLPPVLSPVHTDENTGLDPQHPADVMTERFVRQASLTQWNRVYQPHTGRYVRVPKS